MNHLLCSQSSSRAMVQLCSHGPSSLCRAQGLRAAARQWWCLGGGVHSWGRATLSECPNASALGSLSHTLSVYFLLFLHFSVLLLLLSCSCCQALWRGGVSAAESHTDLVGPFMHLCPWEQVSQLSSQLWGCGQCSLWGWRISWFSLNQDRPAPLLLH